MRLVRSCFLIRFGLPTSVGGSSPALYVSGPAQRSLPLQPARSPGRQSDPLHRRLRRLRCLCRRFDCYRVERTSSRTGLAPVVDLRLFTAHDTPVPVLSPGRGRTKIGRLWTYVRDDRPAGVNTAPAVWFAYSPDRKGEHPRQHLKDFRGVLQADAYAGFGHLYGTGNISEAACMAHARRKFHDIHEVHPSPITTEALDRIGALYGIEREIRGQTVEERREIRQARARPLLDQLHRWLEQKLATLSAKSDTAAAIRYALSRWRALNRPRVIV